MPLSLGELSVILYLLIGATCAALALLNDYTAERARMTRRQTVLLIVFVVAIYVPFWPLVIGWACLCAGGDDDQQPQPKVDPRG